VLGTLRRLHAEWNAWSRASKLPAEARAITVYAESRSDWAHLGPVVERVAGTHGRQVCYLTSDADDPLLRDAPDRVAVFAIGSGTVRTIAFRALDARVLFLTLPDLETFQLKRSAYPVHYAYTFHAMASTHRVYRAKAFDAFDTIYCSGPHHVIERERAAAQPGARPQRLIRAGYPRLDALRASVAVSDTDDSSDPTAPMRVVVAPSWGPSSIVAHDLPGLLRALQASGAHVTLRLHTMTVRAEPALPDAMRALGVDVITDLREQQSLQRADLLISDWSSAALEFAFARERPVLFVDTPPKVNNPDWASVGLDPIEGTIRESLGGIVPVGDWSAVPATLARLRSEREERRAAIIAARAATVFNEGRSAEVIAADLVALAEAGR
jgi:hypothetical protein